MPRALLIASLCWSIAARADGKPQLVVPPPRHLPPAPTVYSPYTLRLDLDLSLLLGGTVLWGGTSFLGAGSAPPSWCGTASTPPCDAHGLNALDRTVLGRFDTKAALAANVMVGVVPGALTVLDVLDAGITHWRGWLTDAVVITEAVVWTGAVQDIVRRAVRRPRPYMYTPGLNPGGREGPEADFSFFSGHTSNVFAMATATAYTYSLRHPGSKWQYLVWTLAMAGATTEPVLRTLSGGHFPTDCIVGALVGSSFGILIPALHRRRGRVQLAPSASITPLGSTVSLAGRF
jgi:membrane-associated phospholipid phosphatase